MVFKCLVVHCANSHKDCKMHIFPKDPEMFKFWAEAVARDDLVIAKRKQCRICDIHFAADMKFENYHNRTNLKVNAIPTLYLSGTVPPCNSVDISTSNDTSVSDMEFEHSSVITAGVIDGRCLEMQLERGSEGTTELIKQGAAIAVQKTAGTPKSRSHLKQRLNLLQACNVTRANALTPTARKFYRIAKGMVRTARQLYVENACNKKRIEEATAVGDSVNCLVDQVNKTTLNFIKLQLSQQRKKSRGRRFSLDDKIFALSLLKQSPKAYKFMQKTFALPSRRSLVNLLNRIPFRCGINPEILNSLKASVGKMEDLDRYCCLVFDEMSLEASLSYSSRQDCIEGLKNCGDGKQKKYADHAMVFMARGIRRKWKQPISFYFSESTMDSVSLAREIKLTIQQLNIIGLKVIATICDQGAANTGAIRHLREQTNIKLRGAEKKIFGFLVDEEEVIPLYDPPHLLKGVRNNLLTADVKFQWKNGPQVASWKDVVALYEFDTGDYETKMLLKLTDAHIYPDKIKKMKVKNAAQVFSHRVSSTMRALGKCGNGCIPQSATNTADFLMFMDKLFDSVNGSTINPESGKIFRTVITKSSFHNEFWYEAIKVLESIKFCNGTRQYVPPSIKNWIATLRGLLYLWKRVNKAGFAFLCGRNLNQDPIENFFGSIRSHGIRNINPTCTAFISSFKSLLVNNLTSSHSPGANCEIDESEGALNSLKSFIDQEMIVSQDSMEGVFLLECDEEREFQFTSKSDIIIQNYAYIAGYMAKVIIKLVGYCKTCREDLISPTTEDAHQLIIHRRYTSKCLINPHTRFIDLFGKCMDVLHFYLPRICDVEGNLHQVLYSKLANFIKINFACKNHNLFSIFLKKMITLYIHTWIKNVNNILKGNDLRNVTDDMKILALERYRKYKTKREKIKNVTGLQ